MDATSKKSDFISRVVANAQAFKTARDQAIALREAFASDAVISGIVDADCVGANSFLTQAAIANYLGVTADIEKLLTNQSPTVPVNRLPSFLAAQPD